MAVQLEIDESRMVNFVGDAKTILKQEIDKYASEIIKEANLIEEGNREEGARIEITGNTISQAVRKNRTFKKKKSTWFWICKVVSPITLAMWGFFFDANGYQNNQWKLYLFIFIIMVATGTTVVSYKEKE